MWAVCPDGGFYARRSDNPKQTMLIEMKPNLALLEQWLEKQLQRDPLRWSTLSQRIRNELWRNAQLSEVIRNRRRQGAIVASQFTGPFSKKADPLLSLAVKGGD
jgi:hypothetical protein